MNRDVKDQIIKFGLVQKYQLTFTSKNGFLDTIKLEYQYGSKGDLQLGNIAFDRINHSLNRDNLELAEIGDTYFDATNHSILEWSHKLKAFYIRSGQLYGTIPRYLNNIIFKLLKFFTIDVYNCQVDKRQELMESFKQELRLEGVVIKVTNQICGDELL